MGSSVKKIIDPGGTKKKMKRDKKDKEKKAAKRSAAAAAREAQAKETAFRKSQRRRSVYGYGGIFGQKKAGDDEAVIQTRRLLGTL